MRDKINAGVCTGSSSGGAGAADKFVDNGGRILLNPHLVLIFWGNAWVTPATPTIGNVMDSARRIVDSPYMSGLKQYRKIGRGVVSASALVDSVVGNSPADPPNPFTDSHVSTLVENLIVGALVPAPNAIANPLYIVFVPTGVGQGGSVIGEHTYYTRGDGTRVPFAWVTNNGTIANLTVILSHEIVEACTDPEGSAFLGVAGTCSGGGWCEIGDVCANVGVVNGVTVQAYYSNRDAGCIIPDAAYEKNQKDAKDSKEKDKEKDKEVGKDHKDNKDGAKEKESHKDGAKEKESHKENKDGAKEKDLDGFGPVAQAISELGVHMAEVGERLAGLSGGTGEAFIRPVERPDVGGYVYKQE